MCEGLFEKLTIIKLLKFILSLLLKTGLPGMKRDCGGAAAVLGAFYAAVKLVSIEMISIIYIYYFN